jgi:uncharacterized repeat protein (TIGR01451 family)
MFRQTSLTRTSLRDLRRGRIPLRSTRLTFDSKHNQEKFTMKKLFTHLASRGLMAGLLACAAGSALYGQIALTVTTSNRDPVAGGIFFSYTVTATNTGPTGPMTVNDFLPAGVQFLSVSSTATSLPARVVCSGPPILTSGSVTCTNPAFPAGAVATITILAQAAANNLNGVVEDAADAIPAGPPFPLRASFLQHIHNDSVLQLFQTATAQVSPGGTIVYNIQVLDGAVSSGLGILVQDQLPPSTTFVSVTGTGAFHDACSFKPDSNSIVCFAAELPTGTAEINIVVKAPDDKGPGTLVNTATLNSSAGAITGSPTLTAATALLKK